jgi:hypothetical protein
MTPQHRFALSAVLTTIATGMIVSVACAQADKTQADKPQQDKPAAVTSGTPTKTRERDRWLIKTASDAEAQEINAKASASTVEKLLAIPRPLDMPLDGSNPFFQQHRARPAETTVFSVEADVIDCRLMPDGDYRVTVRGHSGKTLVLEMPNPTPEFVDPKSKFAGQIKAARDQFSAKFKPETKSQPLTGHARISGVGYFGRVYGNRPAEGNLIQLHPVLNIEWLDKPTAEFTAPEPTPDKPAAPVPAVKPAPSKPSPAKPNRKSPAPKRKTP